MIIVITGPTCSSKSKIAIEVAKKYNGEIINADAFQVYKKLNIGTAKPNKKDFEEIPHHLYDYVEPNVKYSIFNYQKDARNCIEKLMKKNKNIILVGGSGLYIRSVIYDFKFSNKKNVDLSHFEKMDNETLFQELKKIDLETSKKIHINNRRRLLRAISIFLENNISKSDLEKMQKHKLIYKNIYIFSINIDRNKLYEKIKKRVIDMVNNGLFQEARKLGKEYNHELNSLKAIGYKEIINNPNLNDNEIVKLIQKNTCHYAKKQISFIKHQYQNTNVIYVKNTKEIINFIDKNENFQNKQ